MFAGDTSIVKIRLRTGDKAIIVGAAAIAAYEKIVNDDDDLISNRVHAYKKRRPTLVTGLVIMTAAHLLSWLPVRYDPYHQLVKYFRSTTPPPQPQPQEDHDDRS
jgi:hypothetical protein